jgi:hypothetical protein
MLSALLKKALKEQYSQVTSTGKIWRISEHHSDSRCTFRKDVIEAAIRTAQTGLYHQQELGVTGLKSSDQIPNVETMHHTRGYYVGSKGTRVCLACISMLHSQQLLEQENYLFFKQCILLPSLK